MAIRNWNSEGMHLYGERLEDGENFEMNKQNACEHDKMI